MLPGGLAAIVWLSLSLGALSTAPRPAEIVLARCRENIDWVDDFGYGDITTVYDKCGVTSGPGHHIERPNVGRESGTYLQHIVDHYDDLADWTVFSQSEKPTYGYRGHRLGGGHMMRNVLFQDYVEAGKTRQANPLFFVFTSVMMAAEDHIFQCIRHGYGEDYTQPTGEAFKEKMCGTVGDWHQWYEFPQWFTDMVQRLQVEQSAPVVHFDVQRAFEILGVQPTRGLTFFAQGARFAASREAIQARPKAYYEGLLEHLNHQDPWAGYFMEWLWYYILGGSNAPCGFEEPVINGHFAWKGSAKGRQDAMEVQATSGVSGEKNFSVTSSTVDRSIESLVSSTTTTTVVFTKDATVTVSQTITTLSLTCIGTTVTFSAELTFLNANREIRCTGLVFSSTTTVVASSVVTTSMTVTTSTSLTATVIVSEGTISLGGVLQLFAAALMSGTQVTGSGQMLLAGVGSAMLFVSTTFATTITTTVSTISLVRRTDLTTGSYPTYKATVNLGTLTLSSGNGIILDLSTAVTTSGYTSYSNVIGTLNPNGGLLYLTAVSSTSLPTLISTWNGVATTAIEIDNVTTTTGFCVSVLVYGNTGSCTSSWSSVTYDSCQSGYSCTLTGGTYSADSTKCVATFCQTSNGSSNNNNGLLGLIALVAIVPVAGLAGLAVWYFFLHTPSEAAPAYGAYYYPQPYQGAYPEAAYPQAHYPHAAYPQGEYSAYGAEAYPFQGGLTAPMPTPLGFNSL